MRAKSVTAVMLVVLAFYLVLTVAKGIDLLRAGSWQAVGLGVALLVLAALGALLVAREVRFGRQTQTLAREMAAEELIPFEDLPRRPSGRVDRQAADALFEEMRAEVEAAPEDWHAWFRLALAYDAAGDRSRARAAARQALTLHRALR